MLLEYENEMKRLGEMRSNYRLVIKIVDIARIMFGKLIDDILASKNKEIKITKTQQQQHLFEELNRLKRNVQEKLNDLKAYVKRIDRLILHIEDKIKCADKINGLKVETVFQDCVVTRWFVVLINI